MTAATLAMLMLVSGAGPAPQAAATEMRGIVRNVETQQPVDHALIMVTGTDHGAVSGADGAFRVAGLAEGTWQLRITAPGFAPVTLQVESDGNLTRQIEVVLQPLPIVHEEVVVTATGRPEAASDLPQSASEISTADLQAVNGVGLDETLNLIPGVRAESQAQTQEVRISIRGRGERTSFGVSGIRLLVDGMPETDPTGETTDLSGIDPVAIDRIEVVKGPMAGEYGASSSGVINVITPQGGQNPSVDLRSTFGSYGLNLTQGTAGGAAGLLRYFASVSKTGQDGYRAHSRIDADRFAGRFDLQFAPDLSLSTFVRRTRTNTELPGNLSAAQMAANPRQASSLFVAFGARSDIDRLQVGSRLDKRWADRAEASAAAWTGNSDFNVPVPFVILKGHRVNQGGTFRSFLRHRAGGMDASLSAGLEYQRTTEDRSDPSNQQGVPGPSVRQETRTLDNISAFATESISLRPNLALRLGVNRSDVGVRIADLLLTDGDQSGSKQFAQTSYFAGARYRTGSVATWYANVSTGFDPPTISAIGRSPDGGGGINTLLRPERSTNYEGGGSATFRRSEIHASVFHLSLDDEIVPTGVGVPQETFTNAAHTTHDGLELSGTVSMARRLTVSGTYMLSAFHYDRFVNAVADVSGNRIPGVPRERATVSIRYSDPRGATAGADWLGNGEMFVDDANAHRNPAYQVVGVFGGYDRPIGHLRVGLRFRVNNLFAEKYAAYVVVNDRFGGYFYPSPGRNESLMLTAGWRF